MTAEPSWLFSDVSKEVDPPLLGTPNVQRSASYLDLVVSQFQVGTAARYQPRDFDGDGKKETCCNFFVHDVTRALGCEVPRMRANDMYAWLLRAVEWRQLVAWPARALANAGYPVVVAVQNSSGPGHIAMVLPARQDADRNRTMIAQAGASCFGYGTLETGFGAHSVTAAYFAHP